MAWDVVLQESVICDLRWFGRKDGRLLLKAATERLTGNPLAETRDLKTLRPNPVAQRELRLLGKYRVLFTVDPGAEVVTIVLVGEKRGQRLLVQGEEFIDHHENHPLESSQGPSEPLRPPLPPGTDRGHRERRTRLPNGAAKRRRRPDRPVD